MVYKGLTMLALQITLFIMIVLIILGLIYKRSKTIEALTTISKGTTLVIRDVKLRIRHEKSIEKQRQIQLDINALYKELDTFRNKRI